MHAFYCESLNNNVQIGTNGNLIYDFLLVINTNVPPILHCFGNAAFQISKIAMTTPLALKFNPPPPTEGFT